MTSRQQTGRNRDLETGFLAGAERTACVPASTGYARLAIARLDDHGREHGDTFTSRTAADLLAEAGEEALDAGAWTALAATLLDRQDIDERTMARVIPLLDAIGGHAARQFDLVVRALTALEASDTEATR